MNIKVKLTESNDKIDVKLDQVTVVTDGGYERGYEAGYTTGNIEGYSNGYKKGTVDGYDAGYLEGKANGYDDGYDEGLATRTYETWTITLVDGNIVEKEVALL